MSERTHATKAAILDAAIAVFAEKGYRKATVREIVGKAGANIAAINYHFGDKQNLYDAALDHARATANDKNPYVLADVNRDFNADAEPEERLYLYIRTMIEHLFEDGEVSPLARLFGHEMVHPTPALDRTIDQSVRRVQGALKEILRDLMPEGVKQREVDNAARAVISQIFMLQFGRAMFERLEPKVRYKTRADLDRAAKEIHTFTLRSLQSLA